MDEALLAIYSPGLFTDAKVSLQLPSVSLHPLVLLYTFRGTTHHRLVWSLEAVSHQAQYRLCAPARAPIHME